MVGGSGGVGEVLVEVLVRRGCATIFTYISNQERARSIAERLRGEGYVEPYRLNAARYEEVASLARLVEERFGRLDRLAALHGLSRGDLWKAPWDSLTVEDYIEVFRIDFGGFFNLAKAFKGLLLKGIAPSIVAISSTPAIVGDVQGLPYLVAKAAVLALARSLAYMLAPHIRVNIVALGSIETRWLEWLSIEEKSELVEGIPLKRLGKPAEAANAIAFLLSEEASYITGQTLIVDGGEVIR